MDESLKNNIISEIQRVAKENNLQTLTRKLFFPCTNISDHQIRMAFGSWNSAIVASGLHANITGSASKKSNDDLFQELYRVCLEIQKIPTTIEFNRFSTSNAHVYRKRFYTWGGTLSEFKLWLLEKYPESEFIETIKDEKPIKIIQKPTNNNKIENQNEFVWTSKKGTIYGAPMDYKGLRYEPVNEQGVVFLFGKMNEELGIAVEAVKTGFPDCEAKRLIDSNKNLWEPVSIEFEYKSKNFLEHGHDASKCDVIVCWIHNWEECPLEVIELKSIINSKLNR